MNVYAGMPQRLRLHAHRASETSRADPVLVRPRRRSRAAPVGREGLFPDGEKITGCDDPIVVRDRKYNRQHPGLDIAGFDGISDKGAEIFSYFRNQGIKHIAIMGVYSNMCVLGRSFGIRQLIRLGFEVTLVRDLTDVMYDPRDPPYVSHARGAELVVEHIETYWCPSIESRDLAAAIPGSAGPVSGHELNEHHGR